MGFTTTLKTEQLSRRTFKLIDDLKYGDITVPKGFVTNFASIDVFHNLFLFPIYAVVVGYGNYASTVHDWLYQTGVLSRKEADKVFYEALRDEGVARWRAWLMWAGVRIGGRSSYGGKNENQNDTRNSKQDIRSGNGCWCLGSGCICCEYPYS